MNEAIGMIYAPWTPEQVRNLNAYQRSDRRHPFTCANGGHQHGVLSATVNGWICAQCDYTQDWAYAFMAEDRWRDPPRPLFRSHDVPGLDKRHGQTAAAVADGYEERLRLLKVEIGRWRNAALLARLGHNGALWEMLDGSAGIGDTR